MKNSLASVLFVCLCATLATAQVEIRMQQFLKVPEGTLPYKVDVIAIGVATADITVQFEVSSGIAMLGSDFSLLTSPKEITWTQAELQEGFSVKFIDVNILQDGEDDNEENFNVYIYGTPTGGATINLSSSTTQINIVDVDIYPNGIFTMKGPVESGVEGTNVGVTIERMGSSQGSVLVTLADDDGKDDGVTRNVDYVRVGNVFVNFADGETEKTVDPMYQLTDDGQQTTPPQYFTVRTAGTDDSGAHANAYDQFIFIIDPSQATEDPHVVLYVNGVRLPVCFDLNGEAAQTVTLVKTSGLAVSGTFRGGNYFNAINVTAAGKEYYLTTDGIQVGNKKKSWKKDEQEELGDAEFIDDGEVRVKGKDCSVAIEKVDGVDTGSFLNFYVESIEMHAAGGIIGAVLTSDYELKETNAGGATLTSVNGVAVAKKERKFGQECWFVDEEGENLYPNERGYYNM